MRSLVDGSRVNMIDLTAAKIKAAQPEAGLGSGGFSFK